MKIRISTRWTTVIVTILVTALLNKINALTCPRNSGCDCFEDYFTLEFHCPSHVSDITVKLTEDESVDIECNNTYFDLNMLPLLDAKQVKKFTMKYCNFDKNFQDILNRFGMKHVEKFYFEQLEQETNQSLNVSSDMLRGLEHVKLLSITFSKPIFQPNFLENLNELRAIHLNLNQIQSLNWSFNSTPHVQQLDLSRNQIENLSDGVFNNLTDLEVLYLWANSINNITNETFKGLIKLKLLELSDNQIRDLPEGAFIDLVDLVNISLRANNLQYIHSNTFRNCNSLENVRLGMNDLITLENNVFSNLKSLKTIELNNNKLETLPEELFINSTNLEEIKLHNNELDNLPSKLFAGLKRLKRLNLSNNSISVLNDHIFFDLEGLKELSLKSNNIKEISGILFAKVGKLQVLNLSFNKITDINISAFEGFKRSLTDLDLSHNKWNNTYEADMSPINSCIRLEKLVLSYNQLLDVPELVTLVYIKELDLSYNEITDIQVNRYLVDKELNINLTHNKISLMDFYLAQTTAQYNANETTDPKVTIMDISDNPISCDCSSYHLIAYNNLEYPEINEFLNIKQDNLYCTNKPGVLTTQLKTSDIYCPSKTNCSSQCTCSYRPYDKAAVVDCSYRNITSYPDLVLDGFLNRYNQTVLNLTGNNLKLGPSEKKHYQNITFLDLSNNQITKLSWIPPNIVQINLQKNKLNTLSTSVTELLTKSRKLERLVLKDNPWICDCKAVDFQNYVVLNPHKVHTSEIMCTNTKTLLVKTRDLCKTSPYLTVMLPVVLTVLLCFAVLFALYYRYQKEIKIYLYAKNMCLWFVTEEELDKDKIYDVFISYSNEDERFIVQHLLPELEHGDHPFKVCIHIRDWMPGDLISEQVVRSVKDSKRTLVVLSNNFLNSVWGKLEFRTAHTEAMSEGRTRVIVVLLGDIDEDKLDDELKSYLKTNTYVKWGDRYFWNKLRYALPHSKHGFYEKNKRMMLKIDDKFNLVPGSPAKTSTPPITLEPSFLIGNNQVKVDIPEKTEGEEILLA
ncbi:uncharacterized protein LOC143190105 [Rhynchophorus ferrugineus]